MQKGFFTKAIQDEDISEQTVHQQSQQPSRPSLNGEFNRSSPKPTPSWLSVMIVDQRRGSFGFGAHSPMDDDHSNPGAVLDLNQSSHSNRNHSGFSIPKSAFGVANSSTKHEGGDTAGSLLMENAPMIKISEEGQVFVQDHKLQDHEFVGADVTNRNQNLSEKVSTAISLGDFPVATQESLAELREMKERLYAVKEDPASGNIDDIFDMDVENKQEIKPTTTSTKQFEIAATTSAAIDSDKQPPPASGKLVSYIMEKGFAQTWFFQNENNETVAIDSDKFNISADDNASTTAFIGGVAGATKIKDLDFKGMFEKREEERKKKESREENFIAPQNF